LLGFGIPLLVVSFLLEDWQTDIAFEDQALYVDDWELYGTIIFAYLTGNLIILARIFIHRGNSKITTPLNWCLFVTTFGPGSYVALRAVPSVLGTEPLLTRDASWLVIALAFLFVVTAVARVNVFNLGKHVVTAWRWILLGFVFLALDLVVVRIFSLSFSEQLFFLFSLVLIIYIPLRQRLYQWLSRETTNKDRLFSDAIKALLNDSMAGSVSPQQSWNNMLQLLFRPISTHAVSQTAEQNRTRNSGYILVTASNRFADAYQLEYPDMGARAFTDNDTQLVNELEKVFERLWDYQGSYSAGGMDERKRLRRDLHDHVGHKLLKMIHAAPDKTSRGLAEEAMKELANSIKNVQLESVSVASFATELQNTVEEFCQSADLGCTTHHDIADRAETVSPIVHRNLLGVVREVLSNIVYHSGASHVDTSILISDDGRGLNLTIKDDGRGFDMEAISPGDGLRNIKERIGELGGVVRWTSESGTELNIQLQIN